MEKVRAEKILKLLKKHYPKAGIALNHSNPLELLIAVMLSAQCTDKRVNMVTEALFRKYRKLEDYANADQKAFEQDIKSTGFYRNKAKNIIASARMIKHESRGKVPDTMEGLLRLPGVARKTANVVLSGAYGKLEGVCVDTHVMRLSRRWKLTRSKDPAKIEQDLIGMIPREDWERFSLMTIQHGRQICHARKPNCEGCFMNKICPSAFKA